MRGFKNISLDAHEKKHVTFTFDTKQFGYYNRENEFVIEPRPQAIYVSDQSSIIACRSEIAFTGEVKEILHDRVFDFEVTVE